MAATPQGQAGSRAGGGASPRERVWHPLHRCPECGAYTRIIRRPITAFGGTPPTAVAGEVYLVCRDQVECDYQETLE